VYCWVWWLLVLYLVLFVVVFVIGEGLYFVMGGDSGYDVCSVGLWGIFSSSIMIVMMIVRMLLLNVLSWLVCIVCYMF